MGIYSTITGKPYNQGAGLSTTIVQILKDYKKSLPVDFLASVLGLSEGEINAELTSLTQRGVVQRFVGDKDKQVYVGLID